ncbi:MAG: hypothetical protein HS116_08200 [Planctomycetes bacterium]|nr:hypothetical protein [Planctomycetota bacterium]
MTQRTRVHYRTLVVLLLPALGLGAAEAARAGAPDHSERAALQNYLLERLEQDKRLSLLLPLEPGKLSRGTLLKGDAEKLLVEARGGKFDLSWALIGDAEFCQMLYGLAESMPSSAQIQYLCFAQAVGLHKTKPYESLLQKLWSTDASAAKEVKAAWDADRPAAPETEASPGAVAPEQTAQSGSTRGRSDPLADWWSGVVDSNGKVNAAAYRKEALAYDVSSLNRKLGPDYAFFQSGKRDEKFPDVYLRPILVNPHGKNGKGSDYHLGEPMKDPGRYFSTFGQTGYLPDDLAKPGLDRMHFLSAGHNCISFKPEHSWLERARPDPGIARWPAGDGYQPVAMTRSHCMWNCDALVVFRNGVIGATGNFTSHDTHPFVQLPAHKVPVAISITNRSEFAVVAVWDVNELKGQLAVIALGGMHKTGLMALWDWHYSHPGLFNLGGYHFMKLLGYVDLPGMAAPSALIACGNHGQMRFINDMDGSWMTYHAGEKVKLEDPKWRQKFWDGDNKTVTQTAGYVAVVSRYEKKIAFVDLEPLFAYYREMYFTTQDRYEKTRKQGPAPDAWPYSFEHEPKQMPKLVKVEKIPYKYPPTAVMARLEAGKDGWVAMTTVDGRCFVYRIAGLGAEGPVAPQEIRAVGAFEVGQNPVQLAFKNGRHVRDEFLLVSRGSREIQWIKIDGDGGSVTKRLRDARLVDPVCVDDADNNGSSVPVITVADFKSRLVVNYRYGKADLHTNGVKQEYGLGPEGKDEFECGGGMAFPGHPFLVSGANLP